MLKVNEFEHGIDTPNTARRDNLIFDSRANEHFVYDNIDDLLTTEKGRKTLRDFISVFFDYQKPRIEVLDSYSKGDNYTIISGHRRIEEEKADYRIRHNLGGYISDFVTSYVISQPVTVGSLTDKDKALDEVAKIEWGNDITTLNYELGYDASRYGRAFEYHYRDESSTDRVVIIDPKEMFVIRDNTVERNMIAAVHVPVFNDSVNMTIYTADKVITYKPFKPSSPRLQEEGTTPHSYNDVPVVEWWNNRFRMGDFEAELSLIDAYDAAQSDTANYMSDLNDAMLVISGDIDALGLDAETTAKMKEANMLLLQSGTSIDGKQTNVSADYIYKQYDVNGTEAYKTRIANDIFKLSKVPNLDEDSFNTTSSGIALLYKMIGLEQNRAFKVSFYTRALRRRYELISNIHKAINAPAIEAHNLTFTFHPNIPQDVWTEIKAVIDSGGFISQKTLLENATFTDYAVEQERLEKERGASDFELSALEVTDGQEASANREE